MNWEAVGAVSEVVGAIVVVVTLIYLARQIHQANAQTQAQARYSLIDALGGLNLLIASDKQVASVFRRGSNGESLDEDEQMQFFTVMAQFLNTSSVLFDLHNDGLLPDNQWHMIRKDIITLFSNPGGQAFWTEVGRLGVHDRFRDAVDEVLASNETSYTIP